jgi:Domain of unknown function (DUF4157)
VGRHVHEPEQETQESGSEETRDGVAEVERLAANMGNAAFAEFAEEGAGILPDGRAHPDVEAAIARSRGSGGALADGIRDAAEDGMGEPLSDVRVHTDATADALTRAVSARAFTTGTDIYFARGEYKPGSTDGDELIAHELAHVVQQRGAPQAGPMRVSEPGEALEADADAAARDVLG